MTYRRYVDPPSRDAVVATLEALVRRDAERAKNHTSPKFDILRHILGWIRTELKESGTTPGYETEATHNFAGLTLLNRTVASSDRFALLVWCCALYDTTLDTDAEFPSSPEWPVLVQMLGTLLSIILSDGSGAKVTLKRGAIVHLRRAVRGVSDWQRVIAPNNIQLLTE